MKANVIRAAFPIRAGLAGLFVAAFAMPVEAVILFGAGNDTNLTDPGTGLPFDTVARVHSSPGAQDGGSGVHLGGGFMLTAAHLSDNQLNSVTFNGSDFISRDMSFTPVQIGSADLKIFRLSSVPTVGAANVYSGIDELTTDGALVGWGRGRDEDNDPGPGSTTVPIAGGNTPLVKRWGTNDPARSIDNFIYDFGQTTYTFDALETVMANDSPPFPGTGDFEAAATTRDSGAGFFQEIDGEWVLTGIAAAIFQLDPGNVTFGNDVAWNGSQVGVDYGSGTGSGDSNVYVRVSSFADDINNIIPEPSSALMVTFAMTGLLLRRGRRTPVV